MTTKPKKIDEQIDYIKGQLLLQNWKKHSWYVYRCHRQKEDNIVSADIERVKKSKHLKVILELHSIKLNEISHLMWHYGNQAGVKLKSKSLSVGNNLNDYRACNLYLTQIELYLDDDISNVLDAINTNADQIISKYDSIGSLITLYEDREVFKGPLLCMYISEKMFAQARKTLAKDDFNENSGAGDVRFGLLKYLNHNNL